MNMKPLLLALLLTGSTGSTQAQNEMSVPQTTKQQLTCSLKADLVSSYAWRGLDLGHVAVQPELAVGWRGLSLTAWGSVPLSSHNDQREIDLTLSYQTGGLSFGIVDYWDDGNDKRYFYYKKDDTGHCFEAFVGYDFGPLSASWQIFFAGNDYQAASGKRSYSSYLELQVPFRLATCQWEAVAGLVPWKTDYYEANGFSVTCLSLRAAKDIQITRSFSLPLFAQLMANPASQHLFFVAGISLEISTGGLRPNE